MSVHAYVVMTNHLHMIVRSEKVKELSGIIRDFKRFTAKKIYEELKKDNGESRRNWMLWIMESQGKKSSSNKNFKVWRHENHPVALVTNSMVDERINYIHQNPVRAGICYTAEDYKYSSAGAYAGEIGVLGVEMI